MSVIDEFNAASRFLDAVDIPTEGRMVYMSKDTFIAFGGKEEQWEKLQEGK